ncbi:DotU family type VI secretion system protein [Paucibacter sp. R3-3]|uniref:DotU family type VI secretion system protein n=1 Tax=Roseateles agri TaxID=3098619 RepID=A0ABU5DAY7_9BURK|nr:DotU family type VI secretion system protein [Paucibacter sp. R3-3]MDY0743304.1 DotU family type VI secretion system protein [Paucibacter sp. R3-3]
MASTVFHDPFAEPDESQRTFIKPNPSGRPQPLTPPAPAPMSAAEAQEADTADHGLNPLVAAANRLLVLAPQLRQTRHVDDPVALRDSLAQGVREFGQRATALQSPPEQLTAARYVLCTLLDEAAANTPWGGSGVWAQLSLAALFHNDVKGGEKVFQLMARFADKPRENLDVLELIYCALTLGFEGRYGVVDNGRAQLDAVRDRLAQVIRRERGDHPRALAQHWQGEARAGRVPSRALPLAAAAALAALLLAGTYVAMSLSLASRSDPVFSQAQALRLPSPVVQAPQPAAQPRLAQFLQADIKARQVSVRDEVDRSVVTIAGDGAFAPGSATVLPERQALLGRIADALAQVRGRVLVLGHTDNQPLARSARFPSNWHLSQERAKQVRDLLVAHKVAPGRIQAEGRADGDPVVPNDSAANRALNRRVEVTLFVGPGNEVWPAKAASSP